MTALSRDRDTAIGLYKQLSKPLGMEVSALENITKSILAYSGGMTTGFAMGPLLGTALGKNTSTPPPDWP